jgi:hypothetical protein
MWIINGGFSLLFVLQINYAEEAGNSESLRLAHGNSDSLFRLKPVFTRSNL